MWKHQVFLLVIVIQNNGLKQTIRVDKFTIFMYKEIVIVLNTDIIYKLRLPFENHYGYVSIHLVAQQMVR